MKPAKTYLKKTAEHVPMQLRIDAKLKEQVDAAAEKLQTSLNRFGEAALTAYLDALKKEKLI